MAQLLCRFFDGFSFWVHVAGVVFSRFPPTMEDLRKEDVFKEKISTPSLNSKLRYTSLLAGRHSSYSWSSWLTKPMLYRKGIVYSTPQINLTAREGVSWTFWEPSGDMFARKNELQDWQNELQDNISQSFIKSIILIFFRESIFLYNVSTSFVEFFIQSPGEPRAQHLGEVRPKKFELHKILTKTKLPEGSIYSGAFLRKVQKS